MSRTDDERWNHMHKFGISKGVAKKDAGPLAQRLALSPDEASVLSGVGVTSIRAAVASGELVVHKLGTKTLIMRDDLWAWLKRSPSATTGRKTASEVEHVT